MMAPACLVGIDWGASARRAYIIGAGGTCLHKYEDAQGVLATGGHFAESLRDLRRHLGIGLRVPVVMSGMVGSAQGWQEVAYLDNSVPLDRLPETLVPVSGAPGCYIVPGYCYHDHGNVDVMRGEETQLLGAHLLKHDDGCYVLPGTHSKWTEVVDGTIARLGTFLDGLQYAPQAGAGLAMRLIASRELAQMLGYQAEIIDPDEAYCTALARFMEAI